MSTLAYQLKKIKDEVVNYGEYISNFSVIKRPLKPFIVLTRERTGSTCLLDLLSSHSKVTTDPHIFYNYTNLPKKFSHKHIHSRKNICGYKFKTQPSSFNISDENNEKAKAGLQNLHQIGVKIIYLERENLLRQSVSWKLADQNNLKKQNYRKGEKPIEIKSMEFDPEALIKRMQRVEKLSNFEKAALSDVPYLHLKYEKDLMQEDQHQLTLDRICDFLDIESERAITRYARISSQDLRKSISNYQEVYNFLKDTKYFDQLQY